VNNYTAIGLHQDISWLNEQHHSRCSIFIAKMFY